MTGLILGVRLKGDEAGERGDKSTYATDIYTEQKLTVVGRELRQQYRRGNVANNLAGKRGKYESVFLKKG